MTIATGTIGLDSADASEGFNLATAYQTGARFWGRYCAGGGDSSPASQFKLIRAGEPAALAAGGISMFAYMEWTTSEPLNGHAAGLADGQRDAQFLASVGYRRGASVYPSLEPGNLASMEGQLDDYYAGYNQGLAGGWIADGGYMGIPALLACMEAGFIKKGIIPESTNANGIPADHAWIYQPTRAQMAPAVAYLQSLIASSPADTVWAWQDGNKWFAGAVDELVVIRGGDFGSHAETGTPIPTPPAPPAPTPPAPQGGPHFDLPWPGPALHFGPLDHFGNIAGNAHSHGGFFPSEKPYVAAIQDRLLWLGAVAGHSYPDPGWADGIYGNVTSNAVNIWHQEHYPHQPDMNDIYADDWARLFSETR